MFVMSQYCCIANCTCQNRFISPIPIFRLAIFAIGQLSVFWTKFCERRVRIWIINWNKLRKLAFVTLFCNSIINLSVCYQAFHLELPICSEVTNWKFSISFPKHRSFCLPMLAFGCSLVFKDFIPKEWLFWIQWNSRLDWLFKSNVIWNARMKQTIFFTARSSFNTIRTEAKKASNSSHA